MAPPLMEARGLAFGYPGRVVGHDIDLALEAGEVLCLLGPNGTGKTTLMKTLLGLREPLAGEILVEGRATRGWTAAAQARAFGFVPQIAAPTFPFPVRDMVLMGRAARAPLFASPSARDREAAEAALEQVGISALAGRAYTDISGGERQLVLIARAIAQEPRILILDEPTASLDFANQEKVLRLIAGLARQGLGVIFSTHHPDQAFAVANRVALLRDGAVLGMGPVGEVLTAERLSALYGTRVVLGAVEGRTVCITGAALR